MLEWLIVFYLNETFFILIFLGLALSQTTGKISGYVIDAESNDPIVGANIVVKGTSLGTASDEDGIFTLLIFHRVHIRSNVQLLDMKIK